MSPTATTTATSARQARNYDVEEAGNGTDDGLEDRGNAVNDGHQACTDGAEYALDLCGMLLATWSRTEGEVKNSRKKRHNPF